jgi:hypothetical protein
VLKLAKSLTLLFTIGFGVGVGLTSAKDSPDSYNGKWVLDKHSPRPADAPNDLQTKIKQDGTQLTLESSFQEPTSGVVPLLYLGIMTNKLQLNTDGQEQQTQIGPFMAVFKSTMDGHKITTEWKAQINGDPVEGHWVHTLSDDGKHMTLDLTESSTHGQHSEATLNFVRK